MGYSFALPVANLWQAEAQRIAAVVKNLVYFSRQQPQKNQPTDINECIRKVLEMRSYEEKVHNIKVIAEFDPDLPLVTGNNSQLEQVFFNIVINAEFFMLEAHGKGILRVKTEKKNGSVRALFTDNGPGISKDNLNNLFTPFFTTKGVGQGTGLSLNISQGIINEHHGKIYAESEPGQGTTFIVELPAES